MEEMERDREEWFRQFPELPHRIPDGGTFRRLFERLNPGALMRFCKNDREGPAKPEGGRCR